jgi:hypothetical protein
VEDEEHQAEIARLAAELEEQHAQEADRKAAEIIAKLDIERLNAGINKTVDPSSLEAAQSMRYSMKDRYSTGWTDPRIAIRETKPDYNICFNNNETDENGMPKQVQIGKLDFNGGVMKFEGNADQSAMVFMDSLATTFKGRLEAEHVSAAKLLLELVTFELDSEAELDTAYRKGFNDGMATCRAMLKKKIQELERK